MIIARASQLMKLLFLTLDASRIRPTTLVNIRVNDEETGSYMNGSGPKI